MLARAVSFLGAPAQTGGVAEPLAVLTLAAAHGGRSLLGRSPTAAGEVADAVAWVAAGGAAADADAAAARLETASYVAGGALSVADALLLAALPPAALERGAWSSRPALARWADQVAHEIGGGALGAVEALGPRPPLADAFAAAAAGSAAVGASAAATAAAPVDAAAGSGAAGAKGKGDKKGGGGGGGGGAPAAPAPSVADDPIAACDFRVGVIVECWKHPESDKLWCEKVDVGEPTGPRDIASGLQQAFTLEQMVGQRVVIIANLGVRKLAGFPSNGMVLCATSAAGAVEFVEPPAGAPPGERVAFAGHEGLPAASEKQMSKFKIWDAVAPDLKVDGARVATWKGVPFGTSAGPCTVKSCPEGSLIK